LSGNLADKIANTDAETGQVIFGEGFGGVTDLKVGPGDGYLYVLSIGNGAIYKVLPKSASTASKSSSDETSDSVKNPFAENMQSKKLKQDKDLAKETKKQQIKERVEALRDQQLQQQEQQKPQEQQQQHLQLQDISNAANQTLIEKNQSHE
jgi:TolA-binding protein